jgi:hypothetical protein
MFSRWWSIAVLRIVVVRRREREERACGSQRFEDSRKQVDKAADELKK